MQQWYYARKGQERAGPCSLEKLKQLVAAGELQDTDLVWREGLPKWQPASGVPEVIKAVREQAGAGADWIKVYADYRVGPDGSTQPTFSIEELKALVDTAHSSGRPVSAHVAS